MAEDDNNNSPLAATEDLFLSSSATATSTRRNKPKKVYGRRHSAAVKSNSSSNGSGSGGGSTFGGSRRGSRAGNARANNSSLSAGSLFRRARYASAPSLDELGGLDEEVEADLEKEDNNAVGEVCGDFGNNDDDNLNFGASGFFPHDTSTMAGGTTTGRTKRGAKKKRPNQLSAANTSTNSTMAAMTTPSSSSSSHSSSRSRAAREEASAARRSIFSSTKTDLSEFDFEQEGQQRQQEDGNAINSLENSPHIESRGVIKKSKVMIRRSQSVTVTSTSSSLLFEENLHPNESTSSSTSGNENGSSKRRSSCVEKKTLSQESFGSSATAATATSFASANSNTTATSNANNNATNHRQSNSKKRTATTGTDNERDANGFHHELEPSPPKIAAIRSFSSTSSGGSNSVTSSSSSQQQLGGLGESFSSLAKRGSFQCWASATGNGKRNNSHGRSKSATQFSSRRLKSPSSHSSSGTSHHHRRNHSHNSHNSHGSRNNNSHHRSRSQPVGVDLAGMRQSGHNLFSSPGAGLMSTPSVRSTVSSRKRGMFSPSPLLDEGFEGEDITPCSGQSSNSLDGSFRSKSRSRFSPSFRLKIDEEENQEDNGEHGVKVLFSPPGLFGGGSLNDEICLNGSDGDLLDGTEDAARNNVDSDNETIISVSDEESEEGDDESSCSEVENELVEPKEMSDAEIFTSKSSYEDFKYLYKTLRKWSPTVTHGASMGLKNGCLVAIPSNWTSERRAKFIKWSVTAFRFRVGSVGGGSYLWSTIAEGKVTLDKVKRIYDDHKAGKLEAVVDANAGEEPTSMLFSPVANTTPRARFGLVQRSASTGSATARESDFIAFPFCDDFMEDQLVKDMEDKVFIDEKKDADKRKSNSKSVPKILRSISLQPLSKVKNSGNLPCFRRSPVFGGAHEQPPRHPRHSNEHAIDSRDIISQLHGASPSPGPSPGLNPFNRRLRSRANRIQPQLQLSRPSIEHTPTQNLFLSPHPRNNSLANQTPSQAFMETPMPKQVENWGSRPIFGKDWGESQGCRDESIEACGRIFAKSWYSSEFHDNEDQSNQFRMNLTQDTENFLMGYFDEIDDLDNDVDSFGDCDDFEEPAESRSKPKFGRSDSVGGSALAMLHLSDDVKCFSQSPKHERRKTMKLAKFARMTLCATASDFHVPKQCLRFSNSPVKKSHRPSANKTLQALIRSTAFNHILSFLNERELTHTVSLVCTQWADAAAQSLSTLMLISVGCDPNFISNEYDDDSSVVDELDSLDIAESSSIAKSMEIEWSCLTSRFPWAQYLSDGAFKRVYRVWNDQFNTYEAVSVMNVDEINSSGNLNLVGAELAVSVLLSSLSRRNICPNFVITRGVFTCQHEPPSSHWGCEENRAPLGKTFGGTRSSRKVSVPEASNTGNYQYIRMELCEHGDMEDYLRKLPEKSLQVQDCQNLLFQMAFALHVAGDRYGLKHYDVKLLNFFLQSANNEFDHQSTKDRPHVVLRYGVGSHVFRLRMHPSTALIAKLADYGTSILNDTNGQPITLAQFTTFENTPPDYLILGNAAEQGYGHDCFGLGLCMLHLFTGHAPYEEILEEVTCPDNLKSKLRKVWNLKSYDVVRSAMYYVDDDGNETEDETLYNTLYRYLVLFGIPKHQFCYKKHGKVWRAINESLKSSSNGPDAAAFEEDMKKYSLASGNNELIANARRRLEDMDGAMDILLSLVSFDPKKRAAPLDVINSKFMSRLIEDPHANYEDGDVIKSYTAYST